MSKNRHFLWPDSSNLRWVDYLYCSITTEEIESILSSLFPDAYPVLFSSARAGLTAVLQMLGLSRKDLVYCPPFSSHCVLEAVAQISTPTPVDVQELRAALVYHQWGFIHKVEFKSVDMHVIEDSVDSMLIPGKVPFNSNGDFTLWSLPKVIATQGGGVVFCKKRSDAFSLREIRDTRTSLLIQGILRTKKWELAKTYWNGAEAMQGQLLPQMRSQVYRQLLEYQKLIEKRVHFFKSCMPVYIENLLSSGRLPSNIPLNPEKINSVEIIDNIIPAGYRMFNQGLKYPACKWEKVVPLPVHSGIKEFDLKEILERLNIKEPINECAII